MDYIADDLGLNREHDKLVANMSGPACKAIGFNPSMLYNADWVEQWDQADVSLFLQRHTEFDNYCDQEKP